MLKSKLGRAYDESKQLLGSKPGKRAGLLFVILSLSKSEASQFELEDFEKKITSVSAIYVGCGTIRTGRNFCGSRTKGITLVSLS